MSRLVLRMALERLRGLRRWPSRARKESNRWLRFRCGEIRGTVLSIGSGRDEDGEGGVYKDYFRQASGYTTSEITGGFGTDLVLDVRAMPEIPDESYDCVFCSGVLEHVDDYQRGMSEITRVLKRGGILLLGLPFRQAIHWAPEDYWRFTRHGVERLLEAAYEIDDVTEIDASVPDFPSAYWVSARKGSAGNIGGRTSTDLG